MRLRRQPLVRHFCLETEAENLAKWCEEHHPRPAAFDERVAASRALREAGNAEFKKEDWSAAAWRYLAALHSVDFSEKDKVKAGVSGGDAPNRRAVFDELLFILTNLRHARAPLDVSARARAHRRAPRARARARALFLRGSRSQRGVPEERRLL